MHGGQALFASGRGYFICDTTVPRERIPAMQRSVTAIAARHKLLIPTLGHAGDGNIHPIVLYDRADPAQHAAMLLAEHEVTAAAVALGGTITGEHGVGTDKVRDMAQRFRPTELAALRAVKVACDPTDLLNPGVLLPAPTPAEPSLPAFAAAARAAIDARRNGGTRPAAIPSPAATTNPNAAIALDAENLTVTAAADTPLSALHTTLAARGFHLALPRIPTTIGVLVANDDTARAAARAAVLAVRATLPDGHAARFGSNAVKDVAGYDLKRLYIGSGETFGVVQEVTLQVRAGRDHAG